MVLSPALYHRVSYFVVSAGHVGYMNLVCSIGAIGIPLFHPMLISKIKIVKKKALTSSNASCRDHGREFGRSPSTGININDRKNSVAHFFVDYYWFYFYSSGLPGVR
ncbi:hypothetical protein HRM2_06060 [Desulforapulum autotrophicum HRM2]|uniref:Uncharacterized protein n=1 Tax=Desulforapulum autotrophicum (strain ATCC 43914 / DSM 3382 / VKM B-1955 / HRM2) TaxID=177437 RepID=C0QIT0_DESAH|nr:hypothetical protein HRM2_06060 [Desulforapulum autotrophicum HRM2]